MSERLHHLQAQQVIAKRVFEGRPHVWYPNHESLPPPADKPVKKVKQAPHVLKHPEVSNPGTSAKMGGRKELRPGANGQMCWRWSGEVVEEVQQRLRAGERQAGIARAMGMGSMSISHIRRDMVEAGEVLPKPQAQPKPQKAKREQEQEKIKASSFNGSDGDVLLEHVARGAKPKGHVLIVRAPVAEANFTAPPAAAPAPSPVPMPAAPLGPWMASREPVRDNHVLDWADRMRGWKYEDHYHHPRPKHVKRRGLTTCQIADEWDTHTRGATAVNPKRSSAKPAAPAVNCGSADPFVIKNVVAGR